MFGKRETGLAAVGSGGDVVIADAMMQPLRSVSVPDWRQRLAAIDWVPDLGEDIGSLRWFRGLGTLTLLSVAALSLGVGQPVKNSSRKRWSVG